MRSVERILEIEKVALHTRVDNRSGEVRVKYKLIPPAAKSVSVLFNKICVYERKWS
jgi:hypothetical protein